MTPKEKAQELVDSFKLFVTDEATTENGFINSDKIELWNAKQCALIAIDEIIQAITQYSYAVGYGMMSHNQYWQAVKQEIEKL